MCFTVSQACAIFRADNIKLVYDNVTHTTRNNDGVDVRVPGFGNSSSVEYLDPSMNSVSVYFAKVAQKLLLLGYERDVNLHGAPYDFRKAASRIGACFPFLLTLEDVQLQMSMASFLSTSRR